MISFIIPTRNEPEIELLITKINKIMNKLGNDHEIIIIDKSDDDTLNRAGKAGARTFSQESIGLGGALIEGMLKATGDIVFTMDADLSHNPKYIPRFLKEINEGYDVVVGSRKLSNGSVEGWGFKRKIISEGANFIGKYLAGVKVSDLTSGYRAYRLSVVKSLDFNLLSGKGFSFQLEILFYLLRKGYQIKSVPIVFIDRRRGESKLRRREMTEFLRTSVKLFSIRIKDKMKS